jgi:hypothetical protein
VGQLRAASARTFKLALGERGDATGWALAKSPSGLDPLAEADAVPLCTEYEHPLFACVQGAPSQARPSQARPGQAKPNRATPSHAGRSVGDSGVLAGTIKVSKKRRAEGAQPAATRRCMRPSPTTASAPPADSHLSPRLQQSPSTGVPAAHASSAPSCAQGASSQPCVLAVPTGAGESGPDAVAEATCGQDGPVTPSCADHSRLAEICTIPTLPPTTAACGCDDCKDGGRVADCPLLAAAAAAQVRAARVCLTRVCASDAVSQRDPIDAARERAALAQRARRFEIEASVRLPMNVLARRLLTVAPSCLLRRRLTCNRARRAERSAHTRRRRRATCSRRSQSRPCVLLC